MESPAIPIQQPPTECTLSLIPFQYHTMLSQPQVTGEESEVMERNATRPRQDRTGRQIYVLESSRSIVSAELLRSFELPHKLTTLSFIKENHRPGSGLGTLLYTRPHPSESMRQSYANAADGDSTYLPQDAEYV